MDLQISRSDRRPVRDRRLPFRLLTLLDLFGLVATTAVVVSLNEEPGSAPFHAVLAVVGFGVWLSLAQLRSLSTILTHSRNIVIAAPILGATVVLLMQATARSYYSLTSLALFVALWSAWLLACRLVRQRYLPPVRVLTFGSPEYVAQLMKLPSTEVIVADSPPADFDGIDVVALDPVGYRGEDWLRWLLHADMAGVKLISAPLVVETLTQQLPLEALHGQWAEYLLGAKRSYADWKRFMDVTCVLLLAPVVLVVFAIVALVVWLDDRGPVLFWQVRMGRNRKPFRMAKVRSMKVNAEANGAVFASQDDPRITRVGAFIRRFRLDEIPQFWNVLKGEMSLVGPRPEQLHFSREFEAKFPLYGLRYNLRPGITGWAQVRMGYAADADESYGKLRYDLYYVRNASVLLDLNIVIRTVRVMLSGFGAR